MVATVVATEEAMAVGTAQQDAEIEAAVERAPEDEGMVVVVAVWVAEIVEAATVAKTPSVGGFVVFLRHYCDNRHGIQLQINARPIRCQVHHGKRPPHARQCSGRELLSTLPSSQRLAASHATVVSVACRDDCCYY